MPSSTFFNLSARVTPLCRHLIWPSRKTISVGTLCIPYADATAGLRSMSIFRMVILSPILSLTSLSIGGIILQGPHHSAEKSTRTGLLPWMISPKDLFSLVAIYARFPVKLVNFADYLCLPEDHMPADQRVIGVDGLYRRGAEILQGSLVG